MFVSPSNLLKNKILRGRTLNFETIQKNIGNLIIVLTNSEETLVNTISGNLLRPMQMLSIFTPRRIKPFGRSVEIIDQKEYYERIRTQSGGRIKKGKTTVNAYGDYNLAYDFTTWYNMNLAAESVRRHGKILQDRMTSLIADRLNEMVSEVEYKKNYLIIPMEKGIKEFRKSITTVSNLTTTDPVVLFLRSFVMGTLDKSKYAVFDQIIIYNKNADAIITLDLKDPELPKYKNELVQKIIRLNAFNTGEDTFDDIELGNEIESATDEDKTEDKKERLKNVIFSKIGKTLKTNNLTDFEAASRDEKDLIITIDRKIEKYLNRDDLGEKSFDDMAQDLESDNEIKAQAVRYIETKKASTTKLEKMAKRLEKETEIVGKLQDLVDDSVDNKADTFKVSVDKFDSRVEESHLSSIDDEYNKKQSMKDITNVISSFSNSDFIPMAVDDIEITDSSDYQNKKKTVSVRYKTDDDKTLSFQLDVPTIVDKRFFYLGGNKKVIKKQMIRLPITKVKEDRVEITTNFNKMTIERTSGKLSRKNQYFLKRLEDVKMNPAFEINYGTNVVVNSNKIYNNDFEYEELAASLTSIKTPKYNIIFNRDDMANEIATLNVEEDFFNDARTPLALEKKVEDVVAIVFIENGKVFRLSLTEPAGMRLTELKPNMFEFLMSALGLEKDVRVSIGKSFMYTTLKFLATKYPLLPVVASQNGLTDIMKRYEVQYFFSEKPVRGNLDYVEVKFKDKYLYYKDEIKNTLLLSALYLMHPDKYEYDQFDTDVPYTKYFMELLGDSVGIHTRNTLRINLQVVIDPITRDILKDLKLPTDIIDVLLYANTLLVGNKYKPLNDMTTYRIRGNELVADMMYKIIADAYVKYQKHRLNGRPINININKNELIRRLVMEPNVNDKTTLNPIKF